MNCSAIGIIIVVYIVLFLVAMAWEGGRAEEGKTNNFPDSLKEEWRDYKRKLESKKRVQV